MKTSIVLALLLMMASCGKEVETKKSTKSYSLSSLQEDGISFVAYGQSIVLVCSSNGVTNQKRLENLTKFKNSIGLNSSKTINYSISGVTIEPARMSNLLNQAIMMLQQGMMYGGSASTQCPSQVLAQG